jgi:hypothetical protein
LNDLLRPEREWAVVDRPSVPPPAMGAKADLNVSPAVHSIPQAGLAKAIEERIERLPTNIREHGN